MSIVEKVRDTLVEASSTFREDKSRRIETQ